MPDGGEGDSGGKGGSGGKGVNRFAPYEFGKGKGAGKGKGKDKGKEKGKSKGAGKGGPSSAEGQVRTVHLHCVRLHRRLPRQQRRSEPPAAPGNVTVRRVAPTAAGRGGLSPACQPLYQRTGYTPVPSTHAVCCAGCPARRWLAAPLDPHW